ncbi:MAG: NHL repeat-containing protein [Armatimonadetes bacterium]|nr:NHL repeat-containing protein [Armatimonadota bacterium]MDE2205024.1 NHL repeat-containing protein [Armatimonadota bacterium]
MSDRFDFLEIDDAPVKQRPIAGVVPPQPVTPEPSPGGASYPQPLAGEESAPITGWNPAPPIDSANMHLRAVELIGEAGVGAGQFVGPAGIAVDRDGVLYVADSGNHRIQRITQGDVWCYGKPGRAQGDLFMPVAVAVDLSGQFFYVAEAGNDRVQCFRFSGQSAGVFTGFRQPSAVCVDVDGMLWVADTGQRRVLRINPKTQEVVGGIDAAAGIAQPVGLSCDGSRNLYVTDGATNDVTRYSYFGLRGHALGEIRRLYEPRQTAIDGAGRIYLAESGANRLHVFGPEGDSFAVFDTPSTKLGPLNSPCGVALSPQGEIYVSDTRSNRVLRLEWVTGG